MTPVNILGLSRQIMPALFAVISAYLIRLDKPGMFISVINILINWRLYLTFLWQTAEEYGYLD